MSEHDGITCQEAIERLWAFIDDELPATDAQRIAEHLDACRGCHPHHDVQRAFRAFLKSHANAEVPPQLRRRIFMRLLDEERKEGAHSDA